MSSFQAKIGWKRQREKENKNYRFVPFLPDCLEKIQKNSKKIHKISKYDYGNVSSQKQVGKG